MIHTDNYIRYHRVDSVTGTATGVLAELHREQLRIDVVRSDVVRIKISRGRVVRRDPDVRGLRRPAGRAGRRSPSSAIDDRVRVITEACTVSLWLDPFRIDVHRGRRHAGGRDRARTPTAEYWAYATLNDAFTLRRRCRQEDAIFGLGEKSGRHNRKGRDFTLWNTDVLSPFETLEFTQGMAPDDPRGDRTSVRVRPVLRQHPVLLPPGLSGRTDGRILCGQRISRRPTSSPRPRSTGSTSAAGSTPSTSSPARTCRRSSTAYTWLTGRTAPPPLWSLGYHQCRWFDYTQDAVEQIASRAPRATTCPATRSGWTSSTWTVTGSSPGTPTAFPDPPGDAGDGWPSRASG